MSKHIFWIASYPKSGSTLLRAIISSLFFSTDGSFTFELIKSIRTLELKKRLNFIKESNPDNFLSLDKLSVLFDYWLDIQSKLNLGFKGDFMFIKTHHALTKFKDKPFSIEEYCKGYLYILRDPRDVAISWANHANISLSESIDFLTNDLAATRWNESLSALIPKEVQPALILSSWDKNVNSWTQNNWKCPKMIIRFEDLVYDKENMIRKIINFFYKNYKFNSLNLENKINKIMETTDFNKLQKNEKEKGFSEALNGPFFRSGKKDKWTEVLTKDQIKKIEKRFKKTMLAFGYELSKE